MSEPTTKPLGSVADLLRHLIDLGWKAESIRELKNFIRSEPHGLIILRGQWTAETYAIRKISLATAAAKIRSRKGNSRIRIYATQDQHFVRPITTKYGVPIPTNEAGQPMRDAPGRYDATARAMGSPTTHHPR